MKQYVIFEGVKNGDDFTRVLDGVVDEATAINQAHGEWDCLSRYDQKRREYFDLAYVEVDEDGVPEFDYAPIESFVI